MPFIQLSVSKCELNYDIKSLMIALALVDIKPSRTPPQRKKSESIIMKVTQDEFVGPSSLSTHHYRCRVNVDLFNKKPPNLPSNDP